MERLERDAASREQLATIALERARSVEDLSDDLARSFAREIQDERILLAQRRAHGRLIESERERGTALGASARTLRGTANELRAELAGRGTNEGMDRHRHELLGKHGPTVITIAKRHGVTVDALMRALPNALRSIDESAFEAAAGDRAIGEAPELEGAELAAAQAYIEAPDIKAIRWPAPPPPELSDASHPSHAEARKARDEQTAKRLAERKAERERQEKAKELEKRSHREASAPDKPVQRRDPNRKRERPKASSATD